MALQLAPTCSALTLLLSTGLPAGPLYQPCASIAEIDTHPPPPSQALYPPPLAPPPQRYLECSLYLARLLVSCGEAPAARCLLRQLDGDLERHALTLPDGPTAQSLLLAKGTF